MMVFLFPGAAMSLRFHSLLIPAVFALTLPTAAQASGIERLIAMKPSTNATATRFGAF
jgi:hypothetical protein